MKKTLIPIFIILIIIFGAVVAFIATPEEKEVNSNTAPLSSDKILYFYSDTCSYCIKQKPIVEELTEEGIDFGLMDVAENPNYWDEYNIEGTPSFIFKDVTLSGYQSKDSLRNLWEDNN